MSGALAVVGFGCDASATGSAAFNSALVLAPSALDSLLGFSPVTSSTITFARRTLVLHEVSSLRHSATVILHPQSQPSLLACARMVACCSSVKEARSISGIDLNEVTFGFVVVAPCLRRRSAVSLLKPVSSAQSSGVPPSELFAFTSAPLAIRSSTISL